MPVRSRLFVRSPDFFQATLVLDNQTTSDDDGPFGHGKTGNGGGPSCGAPRRCPLRGRVRRPFGQRFDVKPSGQSAAYSALGKRFSFTRATTQIGGRFSVIRAGAFAQFGQDHGSLCGLIARYTEVQWAEAQQIAACNAAHDAAPRLCRWLLQSADRIGSDHLPLTQELIAEMLGVRRTTVTLLAQSLQRRDIIKYTRGRISILDRERLQHGACECYAVMQQEKLPLKIGVTF
jgi:Crp-like helix-turn-helix domain